MLGQPEPPDLLFPAESAGAAPYADGVRWVAPRRGLVVHGREALRRRLAAEGAAMSEARRQVLRRTCAGSRIVDESVVRFIYAGDGIEGLAAPSGARVELLRLRMLDLEAGRVIAETCVETWTVLDDGSPASAAMAPRGRFAGNG